MHASALFEPNAAKLSEWSAKNAVVEDDEHDDAAKEPGEMEAGGETPEASGDSLAGEEAGGFREAAE